MIYLAVGLNLIVHILVVYKTNNTVLRSSELETLECNFWQKGFSLLQLKKTLVWKLISTYFFPSSVVEKRPKLLHITITYNNKQMQYIKIVEK